jgi:hypothetical protein
MKIICGFPDFKTCPREFTHFEDLEAHVAEHYSLKIFQCDKEVSFLSTKS